jgi:O-antigen/teichoic acid export membrane protein
MTAIKLGKDIQVFFSNMLYTFLFLVIHIGVLYHKPFSIPLLVFLLSLLSLFRLGWLFVRNVFPITSTEETRADMQNVYHRQWIYLSLNETFETFSKHIDKIFLLWLLSASAFAIYFNGAYEIPLLSILISVSGTFLTVQAKQQDMDDSGILSMFYKSSLLLSIVLFPLFFFLQLNAHVIFDALFKGKYNASVPVFLISSWIIPLRIANYTAILQTKLKSEFIFRGSMIGLAVKIVACILFYSFWNANGVAMAVVVGTLVQISFYLVHSAGAVKVRPADILPFNKLLFCFVTCAVISVLVKWTTITTDPVYQIISGMLCMIALTAGFYFVRKYTSPAVEVGSKK